MLSTCCTASQTRTIFILSETRGVLLILTVECNARMPSVKQRSTPVVSAILTRYSNDEPTINGWIHSLRHFHFQKNCLYILLLTNDTCRFHIIQVQILHHFLLTVKVLHIFRSWSCLPVNKEKFTTGSSFGLRGLLCKAPTAVCTWIPCWLIICSTGCHEGRCWQHCKCFLKRDPWWQSCHWLISYF